MVSFFLFLFFSSVAIQQWVTNDFLVTRQIYPCVIMPRSFTYIVVTGRRYEPNRKKPFYKVEQKAIILVENSKKLSGLHVFEHRRLTTRDDKVK